MVARRPKLTNARLMQNNTSAPGVDYPEKDNYERFAAGLRSVAWLWILGVALVCAVQLDLASLLVVELTSVMAFELLGATVLAFGPGSLVLGLSYVIERVSYLAADLNLF
jgi:hypothetical protein